MAEELVLRLRAEVSDYSKKIKEAQLQLINLKEAAYNAGGASKSQQKEIKRLGFAIQRMSAESSLAANEARDLTRAYKAEAAGADILAASTNKATAAIRVQGSTTKRSMNRSSHSITQLAYALDDAQYGFRGVQNNLQQIAVTAGLGGAMVLGLTAVLVIIGKIVENFNSAERAAKKAAKEVKNFAESLDTTATSYKQLDELGQFGSGKGAYEAVKKLANDPALIAGNRVIRELVEEIEALEETESKDVDVTTELTRKKLELATAYKEALLAVKTENLSKEQALKLSAAIVTAKEDERQAQLALNQILYARPEAQPVLELTPAKSTLEELKAWQKQALGLMKNFALAWGIEWDKIGTITVMSGKDVTAAIRNTAKEQGIVIEKGGKEIAEKGVSAASVVGPAIASVAAAIFEPLDEDESIGDRLLKSLGQFMGLFGGALISLGLAEDAFLTNWEPGTKIAAGIALVIAGAALSAAYSKKPGKKGGNSSSSSSGSGPRSAASIQGFSGNYGQTGTIIRGQQIRYINQAAIDSYGGIN